MKTTTFTLVMLSVFFIACNKGDVPSLHEQIEGKWRVQSYVKEQYDPVRNISIKSVTPGKDADSFEFLAYDRILVDFDTAAVQLWNYGIIDHRTLKVEGKPWTITKLNPMEFHLSLNVRDTSFKNGDPVEYWLARP